VLKVPFIESDETVRNAVPLIEGIPSWLEDAVSDIRVIKAEKATNIQIKIFSMILRIF
jgi:hypothetical protein